MSTFDLVANSNVTTLKTEIEFNINSIEKEFDFKKDELILEKEFVISEYFGYTGKLLISDRMEYRKGSTVRKKRVCKIEFIFFDDTSNMEINFGKFCVNQNMIDVCIDRKVPRRWCVDTKMGKERIKSASGKLSISFEPKAKFNTPLDFNPSKPIKNAKDFKISCQEQNLKTEIEFNLNLIEEEFSFEKNELILKKQFFTNEDLSYVGKIVIKDWMESREAYRGVGKKRVCKIEFIFPDTSNVEINGELFVNQTKIKHNMFCNVQKVWCVIFTDQMKNKKIESVSGKLSITFEPSCGRLLRAKFNTSHNFNPSKPIQNDKDFQIICQQPNVFGKGGIAPKKVFEFSKSVLIKASPVFQTMLERPEYIEAQKSHVKMIDTTPEIVEAFHNVLFGTSIEEEMFSVGLLRFAHKYEMDLLYEMTQDFLCKQLDKYDPDASIRSDKDSKQIDFLEVLKVANLFDDEKIWSKALECMKRNLGYFKFTMEWKEFIFNEDPEYIEKVLKLLQTLDDRAMVKK